MTIEEVKEFWDGQHRVVGDDRRELARAAIIVDWLISEYDRLNAAHKVLTEAVEWGVEQFRDYGKNNRADILKQKANL